MKKTLQTAALMALLALPAFAQQKTGELQILRRVRFFETTCAGAIAGQSVLCSDATLHTLRLSNNNGAFGDVLFSQGSLFESGRSTAAGYWLATTFAAGNYAATSTGTWTVASGNVATNAATYLGKTMIWVIKVDNSTIATGPLQIHITLPGGNVALYGQQAPIVYYDGTNYVQGRAFFAAGASQVELVTLTGVAFVNTTTFGMFLTLQIPIQ